MVARSRTGGERAQLILVGCLALAFVIVSIGLLINSTMYTQNASPALSNAQVDSVLTFEHETRRATRGLIHRLNHEERAQNANDLDDKVEEGVANYSLLLAESYAREEPAVISISYDDANSEHGTRVIQAGDGSWDPPAGPDNYLNNPGTTVPHWIGWFTVNVNVSETDQRLATDPFRLEVEEESGDLLAVELYRNESGIDSNLTIETTLDNGTTYERNATCNPRRDRVLLDVVTGTVLADGCAGDVPVYGIDDLDRPHTGISVDRVNRFEGSWEFVTNRSQSDVYVARSCNASPAPGDDESCWTPAVWTANLTTTYESRSVSYERSRNVTIYG